MSAWPHQDPASMSAFYGDPCGKDGGPDPKWEATNLVRITPPYPMVLAWAPQTSVGSIRVHRKCAESLSRILAGILNHYGTHDAVQAARMHLYGGAYSFRLMRGAHALSIHSWGAAIDLDPERNAFGRAWGSVAGMMPQAVIDLFEAEGWVSGADWRKPDAMHAQAALV